MNDDYKLVVVSGYFNPLHTGHLDMFEAAAELGDALLVIVNGDKHVTQKGSKPFFNERDRKRLVQAIGCVDYTIISKDQGTAVFYTLGLIHKYMFRGSNLIFANGGDRTEETAAGPEVALCEKLGIEVRYGIGGKKTQSSSELIRRASKWKN